MKSIKKIMFVLTFLICLFGFKEDVHAAYNKWTGFSDVAITALKNKYPDYDFCLYKTGNVYTDNSNFSKTSEFYGDNTFIFAYNSYTSELNFVHPDYQLKPASGSYDWAGDKNWFDIDQRIRFKADFSSYLVENNTLSCKKLIFVETAGPSLHSVRGSLDIHSEASFDSGYSLGDDSVIAVKNSGVTGELFVSEKKRCEEYLEKVEVIADNFNSNKKDPFDQLEQLSKATFGPGDYVTAQGYINSITSLLEETVKDLESVGLTDVASGDGFYIGACKGANSLSSKYKELKDAIDKAMSELIRYQAIFDAKLKAADPDGTNPDYDKDREAAGQVREDIDSIVVIWEDYISKVNTGQSIKDRSCEGLLGTALLNDISTVLTWIRIAVPILLILLGSVDFAKAVLSDDQQELKKCSSRFIKRCIIAVAIFFVPSIIMYLLSFIDKIADVSCDIRLW